MSGEASPGAGRWVDRAARCLVGGVDSPVRSFRAVREEPLIARRAEGAWLEDTDGRRYVDYVGSFGALLAGHAHPAIVEAIASAAARGTSYGLTHPGEVELAEAVLEAFPFAGRVRFVSSGTEAVMTAVRLARGFTGRRLCLRFDGCYHGHSDAMLVKAGSGLHQVPEATSAGIPPGAVAETILCPLDDPRRVEEVLEERGREVACVLVEPVPANSGLLVHREGFLERLRDATRRAGALLVFDEVITGFRVAPGGATAFFGIEPDLVTLGKVLGGGMPVGAVAGPARILDQLAPLGPVYQAGTLSGNPVAMAAGLASVRLALDPDVRGTLAANAQRLQDLLEPILPRFSFPLQLLRFESLFWLLPQAGPPPRRPDQVTPEAIERFQGLHAALRREGVLLPPSLFEVGFVSVAHDEVAVAATAAALAAIAR